MAAGRRRTPEIIIDLDAADIELDGGVQRDELRVVERIVRLSEEFENRFSSGRIFLVSVTSQPLLKKFRTGLRMGIGELEP